MSRIDELLKTLDKETLKKVRRGSEENQEFIPTSSIGLNRILGGGLRKGKQHTFWGNEQSAKTSMLLQTVGIAQKQGEAVAWIDAEHSWDRAWATKLGVNVDDVLVSEVSTIAELTDLQIALINGGIGLLVIDSTGALMPKNLVEKTGELKKFEDTGQLGQMAKDLGLMCKMVQSVNRSCAVVHISQARVDVGSSAMTKPLKAIGGKEVEHTDALRVRMVAGKTEKQAIMGDVVRGKNIVQEKVGIHGSWVVNKNKINGQYGSGDYDFYIAGDFLGIDYAEELLGMCIKYGLVDQSGAWYTLPDGNRFQGKASVVERLRDDEALREKLTIALDEVQ